jgi:hypothetical protein
VQRDSELRESRDEREGRMSVRGCQREGEKFTRISRSLTNIPIGFVELGDASRHDASAVEEVLRNSTAIVNRNQKKIPTAKHENPDTNLLISIEPIQFHRSQWNCFPNVLFSN